MNNENQNKKWKKFLIFSPCLCLALLFGFRDKSSPTSSSISGPLIVGPGATAHYEASFTTTPDPLSIIDWTVSGGTIVAENTDINNGVIYCDVEWGMTPGSGSVAIYEDLGSQNSDITVDITCAVANAGADQGYCSSGSVTIGTAAIPGYTYSWSPTTGLNNPNIAQPTASPSTTTTYTLTMSPANLFVNGDFESGFTGFSTDYGTFPNGDGLCGFSGTFGSVAVTTNPNSLGSQWCYKEDHSPIGTYMLFVDGSCGSNRRVWYETVTVAQNTNYYFSGWASPNGDDYGQSGYIPSLRVRINGTDVIQNFPVPWGNIGCSNWHQFSTTWNSGSATSAIIEIIDDNHNDAGNDFSLDDLFFTNCTITTDQVTVAVGTSTPSITPVGPITFYNLYESVTHLVLTCNDAPSYQWYKNNSPISGATNKTYTIEMSGYQSYTDYYKCVTSCGTSNIVTFNYVGCYNINCFPVTVPPHGTCLSNYPLTITQPDMGTGGTYYWDTYYHPSCYYFSNITSIYDKTASFNCSGCTYYAEDVYTRAVAPNGNEIRMRIPEGANSGCKPGINPVTNLLNSPKRSISNLPYDPFANLSENRESKKLIIPGLQKSLRYMDTIQLSKRLYASNKKPISNTINPSRMKLSPNPADDQVMMSSPDGILQVEIYNISGVLIRQINAKGENNLLIEIINLKPGIYMFRVLTKKGIENYKLVIQRQ